MTTASDGFDEDEALEALMEAFRTRIRDLRLRREWSVEHASVVSHVGRSAWYRLESGTQEPSLRNLIRLQRAFRLASIEALFGPLPTERFLAEGRDDVRTPD